MAELDFDDDNLENDPLPQQETAPKSFWSRFRTIILGGLAGIVMVSGIYFFFFRDKSDSVATKRKLGNLQKDISAKLDEKPAKKEKREYNEGNKKGKYIKLYDLTADEASKALKELSLANLPFTTEQKGKNFALSVDEKRVEEAKNILALKGIPGGGTKGYELLDNSQTLGVTEFDKRVRFVRALSGELEKAILQFDMIENCKVQIVLPEQRLFAVTQPPVTASILIRKYLGSQINDETVFSIIQLVANAVENLQPENVSVIDTEGVVLSNGIFERMAARDTRLGRRPAQSSANQHVAVDEEVPLGTPIIPNFDDIKKWQEVKTKYQTSLEESAYDQLVGILPEGSFKIAINADLGPLENGEIVDVKRLTTSIVVDTNRQDIFLDQNLKKQVFNTIASAIGYVKGRDTIQLNRADFSIMTAEEKNKLARKQRFMGIVRKVGPYLPYAGGGLVSLGLIALGVRWVRKRLKDAAFFQDPVIDTDRDSDFSTLQEEMSTDMQLDRVKAVAAENPERIATIMQQWLSKDEE
jgi:type III secretory pathway lipoprotein EscJ